MNTLTGDSYADKKKNMWLVEQSVTDVKTSKIQRLTLDTRS